MLDYSVSKTKVMMHMKISKNPFLRSDATYKYVTCPYKLNTGFYLNYIQQFSPASQKVQTVCITNTSHCCYRKYSYLV